MSHDVLVTGASVTGPALAWWLHRFGMNVTVVERSPAFRDGGQNIDVRGAGREVLRRMGLEQAVAKAGTGEQGIVFVDENNRVKAEFDKEVFGGNGPTAELEILRGDLARILYEHSRDRAEYVFGDSIESLDDGGEGGIEVTFKKGGARRFDLVIAAEGIGSSTRRLLFGDTAKRRPFNLYMGYFTLPKGENDGVFARWYNAPGGRSVLLRPDPKGTTRAVLTLQQAPCGYEDLSLDEQKQVLKERFADAGWETPRVLQGLAQADDFYFEMIGQMRLECWSKGRTALVGDAAYAPSPVSGMGTSLGLVGAYVLAGELSRHDDHAEAFAAYERIMRPYVDQAQDVPKLGPRIANPRTRFGIVLQQAVLNLATKPGIRNLAGKLIEPPAEKIDLPDYGRAVSR
ncbi:FAD-dependent monooxygenase [Melittangium boletus]|uniref:FAD-binding monooxygenase n=1 Tax=Melittangium boletus DSM 14713 TaxID=1294270 RepID=A0A250IFJ2_9BACT|nr:FAD-dependent monooxygenase [Melittangium boletus]ATB30535.1 FAD-binding monooxygenase [Melittangium boletus DSM 14713]